MFLLVDHLFRTGIKYLCNYKFLQNFYFCQASNCYNENDEVGNISHRHRAALRAKSYNLFPTFARGDFQLEIVHKLIPFDNTNSFTYSSIADYNKYSVSIHHI